MSTPDTHDRRLPIFKAIAAQCDEAKGNPVTVSGSLIGVTVLRTPFDTIVIPDFVEHYAVSVGISLVGLSPENNTLVFRNLRIAKIVTADVKK